MEVNRRTGSLKQRLARMFRPPPPLLRSSSGGGTDIVEPQPLVSANCHRSDDVDPRCQSFPAPSDNPLWRCAGTVRRLSGCGSCRPKHAPPAELSALAPNLVNGKKTTKKNQEGRVGCNGAGDGRACPPASPAFSPSKCYYCFDGASNGVEKTRDDKLKKNNTKKKKLLTNAYGFTSSSSMDSDADDGLGFFSSDEGPAGKAEESETLFSSKSFSSDSSEFYQRPSSNRHNNKNKKNKYKSAKKKKKKESPHRSSRTTKSLDAGCWERSNGYRPLVSVSSRELVVKEEVEEGFAVVKKSRDPYGDFRSSMVEMIADRQLLAPQDLERLLESYLSLNAAHHHAIILQAFSDIWETLFSN